MRDAIFRILFVWYPYVCLTAFLVGSLIRFDRDQYSWRAGSSQMLRKRQLTWGSNLFHFGVLFLFFGHAAGLLTPTEVYTMFMTIPQKQMVAVVAGGPGSKGGASPACSMNASAQRPPAWTSPS